ncbi:hypothetical protein [Stenoxybacter acetivorans]|uniref:hypothetical protein n=1 Tax=Stenoxybacter acetivorans TaxID=422441 RepID=UPI00055C17D4|nr:hypothetical protein [Stenoxybacter acetivorans]
MSAFYLMAVAFIWFKLTQWTGKLWLKWRKNKPNTSRLLIDLFFVLIFLTWLAASFWYGGGRVYYYDAEVKRLCAIDGGVKVYEKVVLSPEDYDKLMEEGLQSKDSNNQMANYFSEDTGTDITIKKGNPTIKRSSSTVIARNDNRVVAEIISYYRIDGEFPVPWHSHGFSCPDYPNYGNRPNRSIERSIFIKEAVK